MIFAVLTAAARVSVVSQIDPIEILVGEQATVTLNVTIKKGQKLMFPDIQPSRFIVPGVEVGEGSSADTSSLDNDMISVSKRYTITSFDEKLYYLPPMQVVVDGKKYVSRNLALKVLTIPVDTLHSNQFFPPDDVQNPPFMLSEWRGPFWLSIAFVICLAVIAYLFVCLRNRKPIIPAVRFTKRVLPHKRALDAIDRIKESKMSNSEDQKTYYTQLTDTLRKYIEERFGFNAMEMTTTEIIENLRQAGDSKMTDELKQLFTTADLVKFARHSALINENDANLLHAIEFINTTKTDDNIQMEERVKPALTQQQVQSMRARTVIKYVLVCVSVIAVAVIIYVAYHLYMLLM